MKVNEITLDMAGSMKRIAHRCFPNAIQVIGRFHAQYPDLEKAHQLTDGLRKIYNQNIPKSLAMTKLAHWFKKVEEADFNSFSTLRKTIMIHYRDILNYFHQRSSNAAAESFNAKIKNFRMQLRGVKDRTFFLFRLTKIFA